MKRFKKLIIFTLSFAIAFQLSGVFSIIRVYADEAGLQPDQQNQSTNQISEPPQGVAGALEEGAAESVGVDQSLNESSG